MSHQNGFERRGEMLLPAHRFLIRILANTMVVVFLVAGALGVGMWGYMRFEGMRMVDAFANAAMILSGMGPLTPLNTDGGKLFAGFYAIGAGIFFIFTTGILLSPLAHRLLHRFHLDEDVVD